MSSDLTVEEKAEALARLAAERAARLALEDAEKAQEIAVARAVKDANIDRDLREHGKHLEEINGSQREMASSLAGLLSEMREQTVVQQALAQAVETQHGKGLSRKTLWLMGLAALAAYLTLVVLVISLLLKN